MAWNRKHRRITELEAALAAATNSIENITASRDAQTRYAAEKVVDIQRLTASIEKAGDAIGMATELIDTLHRDKDLLVRVGGYMAAHAPAKLQAEWADAVVGKSWRAGGRFLPRSER